jgi:hypothetical protein
MDCGFITRSSEENQYKIDWTLEDGTIIFDVSLKVVLGKYLPYFYNGF